MKNKTLSFLFSMAILIMLCFTSSTADNTNTTKRLLEEVDVTNALVTIRVYYKGKPVENLQRNHFKVFEDGKLKKINVCTMNRKTLGHMPDIPGEEVIASPPARLFVLIFNICDYRMNMYQGIERFFEKILGPNDRLIVMTNRFFLKDHTVVDPAAEKRRVFKMIEIEMKYAKSTINEIEKTVNSFIHEYHDLLSIRDLRNSAPTSNNQQNDGGQTQQRIEDVDGLERAAVKHFVAKYCSYVKEIKNTFLKIPLREYIELAQYLKDQEMEKWVLNFYQIPRFPQPSLNTEFVEKIHYYGHFLDILDALNSSQDLPIPTISRSFINSGATFHTVLLKYQGDSFENLPDFLNYGPISNDSEEILRRISRDTGGNVMRTNRLDSFYDKISTQEDIYYVLAYQTRPKKNKTPKLRIQVWDHSNRIYKVVYDNRKRSHAFKKAEKKFQDTHLNQELNIHLKQVEYGNGILRMQVSNFKMDKESSPPSSKFRIKLQLLDQTSRVVFFKEKQIETIQPQVMVGIKLNTLEAGQYDAMVIVEDILSGQQDLAIREVTIRKPSE